MARIQWQRFEWRCGADIYVFEVADGGLFGTLTAGDNRKVTLPIAAWEGMLDCVTTTRRAKAQNERTHYSDRSGARWSDPEVARLEQGFRAGRNIAELARMHARSAEAIEAQLAKLGLWNRLERRPMSASPPFPDIPPPDSYPHEHRGEPADWPR